VGADLKLTGKYKGLEKVGFQFDFTIWRLNKYL
jgi:hypothetical protein